ncbi:MAG: acyl-CoA dehydrogenase C-terminal domain-containing protein [Micavibrio sp.]|nr:acyl-CoA dehydrogenase C-terminal domain-containing protein [Micavibrio sp.]
MPVYKAPLDDIKFVLNDVLNLDEVCDLPGFEDASPDLAEQILEEGAKICEDVFFPLNQIGDSQGCKLDNCEVTTPEGFKEAYATFAEGGWCGLSADPEFGGMGMPLMVDTALKELICSANMSLGMYPGLSHGAYDALYKFGTDEQKELYIPKLIEGTWSGTMCLTEPQCGTDLGLIKSKADPQEDGSFKITGTKIFISAGEHDLTENILHLVLAKLPDAPEGVKGISLFIVPKFIPNEDGSVGERNTLVCGSLEHKMGIHGNSTCVMNFDDAKGWLVGEPHKGLRAMFAMMNNARLGVAMQGLGIAEVAYQNAVEYAKERVQMRSVTGTKAPDKPADPIIVHPDVRRMLLIGKAFTEGARVVALMAGAALDKSHNHADSKVREHSEEFVALLTPILKAYFTDMGSEIANLAVQVYGGHGFIAEHGVEQYVRDARIAQIYEGTNGIQALDLVGRKMPKDFGRLLRRFFHPVHAYIETNQAIPEMAEFIFPLAKSFAKLQQSSAMVAQKGLKNPDEAGAASVDYLRQFALVAMAYVWCLSAETALKKLESGEGDKEFYEAKLETARFFMTRMLPEADAKFKMVLAGSKPLMSMKEAQF